jgi:CDP-6-deoxy-D-xylo-4-hexulose-3-dehydrase
MGTARENSTLTTEALRKKILDLVGEYAVLAHKSETFQPGLSSVPVSGRVYGGEEVRTLVDASLDFWLTTGRFNEAFEKRLSQFLGVKHVLTANSGSSANLLAVAALTSPFLKERALKAGDEVITVAASFPTTVNPLLFYGLVPVFVDIEIPTYNAIADQIEGAITEKTKAIVLAHTLGNPFDLERVMALVEKHNLWLIEDCCDALGSTYQNQKVGTFGHIGTLSFYPAHHITMGEGGAVFTNRPQLSKILESFRDWGRDCWCDPGKENTCGKRFSWELGQLPKGYDHKYIYSHAGFNLKITDMQAAVALAQMDRLEDFIAIRKRNFNYLKAKLKEFESYFILPEATSHSDPAWFGFLLTIRDEAPFKREELMRYLNDHQVATRLLFAGNITRQPYFSGRNYKVSGSLQNTDSVMRNTFWIGVYPKLTEEMLDYAVAQIRNFVQGNCP